MNDNFFTISSLASAISAAGYPPVPDGYDASWSEADPASATGESKWVRHLRLTSQDEK